MSNLLTFLFLTLGFITLFDTGTATANEIKNKEGFDVRLIAAYFDPQVVTVGAAANNTVQLSDCLETDRQPRYQHGVHVYDSLSMDCVGAASAVLKQPVIGRFTVYPNVLPGTLTPIGDATIKSAKLVRVFVASRKEAVRYASGIGFYFGFEQSFVAKDQLSLFADATMRGNNEAAAIYQFAGLVTGTAFESVTFKPYMEFAGTSDTWRVWENLESRSGSDAVEGSVWGSGNYILRANRVNSVKFDDVVNENHLIVIPAVMPDIGSIVSNNRDPEITTISVYPDRRETELLLQPYVSSYPLRFTESQSFVQAGTKLWVRFSDQIANGRDVKMFWSLNGGNYQEAQNYLGGNCYGFKECFAVPVAGGTSGVISYSFTLTSADGSVADYKNGDDDFLVPVRRQPAAIVHINTTDVTVDRVADEVATFALRYDARRAVDLLRASGKIADELSFVAEVTTDTGTEDFPLGVLRSWTDGDMKIHYIADLALTPHTLQLPAVLGIKVKIKSRTRGIPDGEYVDVVGTVTID